MSLLDLLCDRNGCNDMRFLNMIFQFKELLSRSCWNAVTMKQIKSCGKFYESANSISHLFQCSCLKSIKIFCDIATKSHLSFQKYLYFFLFIYAKERGTKVNIRESSKSTLNLVYSVSHHNIKLRKPTGLGVQAQGLISQTIRAYGHQKKKC